jgi:hypothetical protein
VGVLALLAIAGIHLWDELPAGLASGPSAKVEWSVAVRTYPAFAVSQFDLPEKTETYQILRHPGGGRKDVLRWTALGEKPVAEVEIYRPGAELRRGSCAASATSAASGDWVSGAETPRLRGTI